MILIIKLYLFWVLYLAIMALYRAHLNKSLTKLGYVLGFPLLIVGAAFDVFMNIFVFTFIFAERPKHWLVTDRLKMHLKRSGWRYRVAKFICEHLLNFADPTSNHCD